jgi:REP element-mobilizing transposase RayT
MTTATTSTATTSTATTRGGKRPGAGRKKTGKRVGGPHRARPFLDARHPVHVVLRSRRRLNWRQRSTYDLLRRVLGYFLANPDFRIIHMSIQRRHLHLIVEAASREALSAAMKSFATRVARALNKQRRWRGKVWAYRYHATQITTDRYARHALAYVLNNWRRHREDVIARTRNAMLDPYSSAVSFTGWTKRFTIPAGYEPLPVSDPQTALLSSSWMWWGLIDPWERPGPITAGA